MSENRLDATIARIRDGLSVRRMLVVNVDVFIYSSIAAALGMLLFALDFVPLWCVLSLTVAVLFAGWFIKLPRKPISASDAGLFVDRKFGLKERLASYASDNVSRSVFTSVQSEDAAFAVAGITDKEILGSFIPYRLPYLALPLALVLTLGLLSGNSGNNGASGVIRDARQVEKKNEEKGKKAISGRLAELIRKRKEIADRLTRFGAEKDRIELARIDEEIKREYLRHLPGKRTTKKAKPDVDDDSENGKGVKASSLATVKTVAKPGIGSIKENVASNEFDEPDWDSFRKMQFSLPPTRREIVRAYMNSIAGIDGEKSSAE